MALVVVVLGASLVTVSNAAYRFSTNTDHFENRKMELAFELALLPYYKHGPVWTSVTNMLRWYRPRKRAFIARATSDATKSGSARPSARKARPAFLRFVYLAILRAVRPLPREPSSCARESTKATLSRAAQKRPQAPRERPRGAREGRSARGHARLDRRGRTRPAPSFRGVTAAGRATRERTHRRDGVRGRRQGDALPGGNEM